MGDFSQVQKYLGRKLCRVATEAELRLAPTTGNNPTKMLGLVKSRPVTKFTTKVVIPAFSYTYATLPWTRIPSLLFQYNITFNQDFYIVGTNEVQFASNIIIFPTGNLPSTNIADTGAMFVKWREGNVVSRYFIAGVKSERNFNAGYYPERLEFIPYTNQLVKKNFVIEFWLLANQNSLVTYGMKTDLVIETGLLNTPVKAEDTDLFVVESNLKVNKNAFADLTALDFQIPTLGYPNTPTVAWEDNP